MTARRLEGTDERPTAVLVARQPPHRLLHRQQAQDDRRVGGTRRGARRRAQRPGRLLDAVEPDRVRAGCRRSSLSVSTQTAATLSPVTTLDTARKEYGHRFPVLPAGPRPLPVRGAAGTRTASSRSSQDR
ncbi:MAG: hypothetical protein MZW92_40580 [Comamonadaceae bacterium]|nr:hypothetical protein [Comamonadaceae bacterium]